MMLVTLEQASDHLRRDMDDGDENDLTMKIEGASGAVMNYLKSTSPYALDDAGEPVKDEDGNPIVRPEVKNATLLMLGYLYKDRDNDEKHEYEMGYLPRPVMALLYPLRDPALA